MIDSAYFKEYRAKLGFSTQDDTKNFFSAKDILPTIDYGYIELLNKRLIDIIEKLNSIVSPQIQIDDIDLFCKENILSVFEQLKQNKILPLLNNQGRRPEEVYFSWVRGYIIAKFYHNSIANVFEVDNSSIVAIGDDDFSSIDRFKRTPKADIEISLPNNERLRIEMQSGFQGANDVKQHKILEARKVKYEQHISTVVAHFDLFNGQVAFIQADAIPDDNINWITRQQMEGQTVFHIEQNFFIWKLTENPPKYKNLILQ